MVRKKKGKVRVKGPRRKKTGKRICVKPKRIKATTYKVKGHVVHRKGYKRKGYCYTRKR